MSAPEPQPDQAGDRGHAHGPPAAARAADEGAAEPPPLSHFRCAACGYGVCRAAAPERCPMCAGSAWVTAAWRPWATLDADAPIARDLAER
jgi:rubredoxin